MLGVPAVSGQKTTKTKSFLQPPGLLAVLFLETCALFSCHSAKLVLAPRIMPFSQIDLAWYQASGSCTVTNPSTHRLRRFHPLASSSTLWFFTVVDLFLWNLDSILFQVVFDGPQSWYDAGDIYIYTYIYIYIHTYTDHIP